MISDKPEFQIRKVYSSAPDLCDPLASITLYGIHPLWNYVIKESIW